MQRCERWSEHLPLDKIQLNHLKCQSYMESDGQDVKVKPLWTSGDICAHNNSDNPTIEGQSTVVNALSHSVLGPFGGEIELFCSAPIALKNPKWPW